MVEFSAVTFIFFLMLFPVINLVSLTCGAVGACLITRQASIVAAGSTSFASAKSGVSSEAANLLKTCFAFAGLKPVGGIDNNGIDLFINKTSMLDDSVEVYGPNTPVPGMIDLADGVYEYEAISTFDVMPYVNLSSLPFLGTVPGVGCPVRLRFQNVRACEHPEGLSGAGTLYATLAGVGSPGGLQPIGAVGATPQSGGDVTEHGRRFIFTSQIPSDDPNNPGMYSMQLVYHRRHGDDIFSYRGYFAGEPTTGQQVGLNSRYTLHDHRGQELSLSDNPFSAINPNSVSFNGANFFDNAVVNRVHNQIENSRHMSTAQKNVLLQALEQMHNWALVNHYR